MIAEYDIEEGLYVRYENNIPGSQFEATGGLDNETTIYLPDDDGKYTIVLKGTGTGTFSFDIDRLMDFVVDRVRYSNIPVTPLSVATTTLEIPPIVADAATTSWMVTPLAKSLMVDFDGNGTDDAAAEPNAELPPTVYLNAIRSTIVAALGDTNRAKQLLKRVDKIEKNVMKGKDDKIFAAAMRLFKRTEIVGHKERVGLSEGDKEEIIAQIETLVAQFE